jgi:hypothetical protein
MRESVCAFRKGIYGSELTPLEMASQNLSSVFWKFVAVQDAFHDRVSAVSCMACRAVSYDPYTYLELPRTSRPQPRYGRSMQDSKLSGRQRRSLLAVIRIPRATPYLSMHRKAYSEHVG